MHRLPLIRRLPAFALAAAMLVATLLAGCESMTFSMGKKIDYKSAGSAPSLEIPPDLTTPNYDDRYQSSTALGAVAARAAPRPSEVLPPNPDAHIVRAGSERWLVVKANPEAAWATLRDFWAKNGFVLAVEEPALGIMETDWAESRNDKPQGFLEQFSNKYISFVFDTYKRDKFRTRIERGSEPGTVEIYISHRGMEQVPTVKIDNVQGAGFAWGLMPPNPGLEAEMLSRLMMRFGAPEATAEAALTPAAAA